MADSDDLGTDQTRAMDSWMQLVAEWDRAYARFLAARDAKARSQTGGQPARDLVDAEEAALAELTELKRQMDSVVAEVRRSRKPITDSIVVGRLETGTPQEEQAGQDRPEQGRVAADRKRR